MPVSLMLVVTDSLNLRAAALKASVISFSTDHDRSDCACS